MIRRLTTKKEQILDAALKLVSKKNTFDITIREISAEADVNVAAVNYYFKSKDQLFQDMEKLFLDNFVDAFTPLDNTTLSDYDKLIAFLKKAISYATHYPGILVLLKEKFSNPSENELDIQMQMDFLKRLVEIKELFISVVQPSEEETDYLFMSFGASLIFPFVADNYIEGIGQFMSEEEHLKYMKTLINKFKK